MKNKSECALDKMISIDLKKTEHLRGPTPPMRDENGVLVGKLVLPEIRRTIPYFDLQCGIGDYGLEYRVEHLFNEAKNAYIELALDALNAEISPPHQPRICHFDRFHNKVVVTPRMEDEYILCSPKTGYMLMDREYSANNPLPFIDTLVTVDATPFKVRKVTP